jgi:hypothetical protein
MMTEEEEGTLKLSVYLFNVSRKEVDNISEKIADLLVELDQGNQDNESNIRSLIVAEGLDISPEDDIEQWFIDIAGSAYFVLIPGMDAEESEDVDDGSS